MAPWSSPSTLNLSVLSTSACDRQIWDLAVYDERDLKTGPLRPQIFFPDTRENIVGRSPPTPTCLLSQMQSGGQLVAWHHHDHRRAGKGL